MGDVRFQLTSRAESEYNSAVHVPQTDGAVKSGQKKGLIEDT